MKRNIFLAAVLMFSASLYGQVYEFENEEVDEEVTEPEYDPVDLDSLDIDTAFVAVPVPKYFYTPQVYMPYQTVDSVSLTGKGFPRNSVGAQAMQWIERERTMNRMIMSARRRHAMAHP
ncbi:MAG: hypothetical protein K2G94_09270 [Muribaculaceae bacterium]|nr:hypothetical protein [Muribaculaceae bacterium]